MYNFFLLFNYKLYITICLRAKDKSITLLFLQNASKKQKRFIAVMRGGDTIIPFAFSRKEIENLMDLSSVRNHRKAIESGVNEAR